MDGLPVTIRLLDPPLHEFLPHDEASTERRARAGTRGRDADHGSRSCTRSTRCSGTRGCRLGILYPEIYEMQVRAIVAPPARRERGRRVDGRDHDPAGRPRARSSTPHARRSTERGGRRRRAAAKSSILFGTMIEVPRAALLADEIAEVCGVLQLRDERPDPDDVRLLSRDDARASSSPTTSRTTILPTNPFETLDRRASASSSRSAPAGRARRKPGIKLGICGEHGGDPASVEFCQAVGLDYVSCSPYRVPAARLAAAQAALAHR